MHAERQREVESQLRALAHAERYRETVDLALRSYGGELMGFIMNTVHDEALAQDIFQQLSIEVWESLPGFRWQSNFRTWVYTLARRTTFRILRAPDRRYQRLHTAEEQQLQARWSRTSTLEWQKTENKDRFWLICEGLEPEQRSLVMLRIAQRLSWAEITVIMSERDDLSPDEARRLSAKYRKRFARTKTQLKAALQKLA